MNFGSRRGLGRTIADCEFGIWTQQRNSSRNSIRLVCGFAAGVGAEGAGGFADALAKDASEIVCISEPNLGCYFLDRKIGGREQFAGFRGP